MWHPLGLFLQSPILVDAGCLYSEKFKLAVVKKKISPLSSLTYLSFGPLIDVLLIQLNALTENCRNKFGSKVCWIEE